MPTMIDGSVIAFVASTDLSRSRDFYCATLGLSHLMTDEFAVQCASAGTAVRIALVPGHVPTAATVVGWEVPDIEETITSLVAQGVVPLDYPWFDQSDLGVWTSPSGARVAWFQDPDGNVLSLTQTT